MSEYINNREMRKEAIKDIIRQLHEGKSVDEVKKQFDEAFKGVSAGEISEAEAALVSEGVAVEEIQKLCDVHAAVFKGSIDEIHKSGPKDPASIPGHPVNTLIAENRKLEEIIKDEINNKLNDISNEEALESVISGIKHLSKIENHYLRKENLIFPYMEKYGITAPPKVMWGVDDEIRAEIKDILKSLQNKEFNNEDMIKRISEMIKKVEEMIFKEENIMLPMLVENLTQDEWKAIYAEFDEFEYLIENVPKWEPPKVLSNIVIEKKEVLQEGFIELPTGTFNLEQLRYMLNTLPFDITFVDKDDIVKYFSQGPERIFPRTKAVIGRNVANCHPHSSVHIVEKIVNDFKTGKKDNEDFWINMGNQFILIRYFAVRNENKEYLGVLEVTQNIKPIQQITGEKRLVSE